MKTISKFKWVVAFMVALGFLISCNQSPKNNRDDSTDVDSEEIRGMNDARVDETEVYVQTEMDRIHSRLDNLDENDPEFNTKLRGEMDRLRTDFDSLKYRFHQNTSDYDDDLRTRYDSIRVKRNDLDDKLERWSEETGENLEELGDDIKREYRELKESLRNDNR